MLHPRPKPGARNRFGTSLTGDATELNRVPHRFQARRLAALDRMAQYRAALDCWHDCAVGEMPQPQDHGINLPDLDPAQVLWGAA